MLSDRLPLVFSGVNPQERELLSLRLLASVPQGLSVALSPGITTETLIPRTDQEGHISAGLPAFGDMADHRSAKGNFGLCSHSIQKQ